MFPYCGVKEDVLDPNDPRMTMADWDCIRGSVLGALSVLVFAIAAYASVKIGLVWAHTRWYTINIIMLFLATLQCLLTSIRYLAVKEQRLTYTAAYLRGLQTLIASANYGKAASESNDFLAKYYVPTLVLFVLYLTIVYVVALSMKEFDCYHPHWLVMSVSQVRFCCCDACDRVVLYVPLLTACHSFSLWFFSAFAR